MAVVGCGSGDNTSKNDLGVIVHDLSTTNPLNDLSVAQKTGCSGYLTCQNNCPMDSQANFDACNTQCQNNTTSKGKTLFNAALRCGQTHCLGTATDGGTSGKCMIANGQLVNQDGSAPFTNNPPTDPCGICLNNSLANLFGGQCLTAQPEDCNPAECTAAVSACTADTP
jgi:hypothetical protein